MKINRSILPPGRIGLAVSGGSDSVALAFLLTKGGKKRNASERFVILHVDHGIREESKEEFQFVKSLSKRLSVPFKGIHAKVVRIGPCGFCGRIPLQYSIARRKLQSKSPPPGSSKI
jgi:tRNA(Ile)-lysidine synthase TilS/MesJ